MDNDPSSGTDARPLRRTRRAIAWTLVAIVAICGAALAWYVMQERAAGSAPATSANARAAKGKGAAGGTAGEGGRRGGADPRTVLPVAVEAAKLADVTVYLNALGNVVARNTVTVRPRVDGQLAQVLYREGQAVKAGDLLAQIDPRPFEVALAQANGQLARDQAQLANARVDLDRYRTLLAQDSIARQQVDTQEALVRQYEGVIEADRATVDNAKLQLSYTRITAPIGGRLGLRQVDPGNMVRQTDANGIVVITQVQPIGVLYSIPEDKLAAVMPRVQAGDLPPVEAYDREGKVRIASGRLVTVDNQIDPTTGTVRLKAEFGNENAALFPNQFVNVRMQLETLRGVVVVPSAAIQRGSPGTFVYRVNDDDTVSVRVVQLGPTEGETTVIVKGLIAGERVVTDGADKLRDGAKIEPVSPEQQAAARAPAPPGGSRPKRNADASGSAAPNAAAGAGNAWTARRALAGDPTAPAAADAGNARLNASPSAPQPMQPNPPAGGPPPSRPPSGGPPGNPSR